MLCLSNTCLAAENLQADWLWPDSLSQRPRDISPFSEAWVRLDDDGRSPNWSYARRLLCPSATVPRRLTDPCDDGLVRWVVCTGG